MAIIVNTRTWADEVDVDDDRAQDICDSRNQAIGRTEWVVDSFI